MIMCGIVVKECVKLRRLMTGGRIERQEYDCLVSGLTAGLSRTSTYTENSSTRSNDMPPGKYRI